MANFRQSGSGAFGLQVYFCFFQLTSQEESQTQPNIDRDSHVAAPSGDIHPYATSKPSAGSFPAEIAVVAFTSGSASRMNPISRMLRQAPFPEHMLGQAYLVIFSQERRANKTNGLEIDTETHSSDVSVHDTNTWSRIVAMTGGVVPRLRLANSVFRGCDGDASSRATLPEL